jgi:hypothetical protein
MARGFFSPEAKGPHKNALEIALMKIALTFNSSFMNGQSW